MWTFHHLHSDACQALKKLYPHHAAIEARYLIQAIFGLSAAEYIMQCDNTISSEQYALYQESLKRRLKHEPVSRIVQKREFWGETYRVTPATLDPRPDSETLIEAVLEQHPDRTQSLCFLDLGTGSGCLLITLLKLYPKSQGWAVDVSRDALDVAEYNAAVLGVSEHFYPLWGSWDSAQGRHYDIIISNPPYIPRGDIAMLASEVRDYDPHLALDGGVDGLDAYRSLAQTLPALSHAATSVFLEIGHDQRASVSDLFGSDFWHPHSVKRDLAGHDRVLIFKRQ